MTAESQVFNAVFRFRYENTSIEEHCRKYEKSKYIYMYFPQPMNYTCAAKTKMTKERKEVNVKVEYRHLLKMPFLCFKIYTTTVCAATGHGMKVPMGGGCISLYDFFQNTIQVVSVRHSNSHGSIRLILEVEMDHETLRELKSNVLTQSLCWKRKAAPQLEKLNLKLMHCEYTYWIQQYSDVLFWPDLKNKNLGFWHTWLGKIPFVLSFTMLPKRVHLEKSACYGSIRNFFRVRLMDACSLCQMTPGTFVDTVKKYYGNAFRVPEMDNNPSSTQLTDVPQDFGTFIDCIRIVATMCNHTGKLVRYCTDIVCDCSVTGGVYTCSLKQADIPSDPFVSGAGDCDSTGPLNTFQIGEVLSLCTESWGPLCHSAAKVLKTFVPCALAGTVNCNSSTTDDNAKNSCFHVLGALVPRLRLKRALSPNDKLKRFPFAKKKGRTVRTPPWERHMLPLVNRLAHEWTWEPMTLDLIWLIDGTVDVPSSSFPHWKEGKLYSASLAHCYQFITHISTPRFFDTGFIDFACVTSISETHRNISAGTIDIRGNRKDECQRGAFGVDIVNLLNCNKNGTSQIIDCQARMKASERWYIVPSMRLNETDRRTWRYSSQFLLMHQIPQLRPTVYGEDDGVTKQRRSLYTYSMLSNELFHFLQTHLSPTFGIITQNTAIDVYQLTSARGDSSSIGDERDLVFEGPTCDSIVDICLNPTLEHLDDLHVALYNKYIDAIFILDSCLQIGKFIRISFISKRKWKSRRKKR